MIAVRVGRSGKDYQALIGSGLLEESGLTIARALSGKHCAIVTDTNVGPLFGNRVQKSLTNAGFKPVTITVAAGEQAKTLEQVGLICDQMIAAGLDRQSFVVGLGGGVIGDVSGFVAAIFQRGIPHVQIPTTLLAMVDSSIGGKTGVNTRDGKNLIGATHHPSLVIDDLDLLKTLQSRELKQGFAEIIKHAVIADKEMFAKLSGIPNPTDKMEGRPPCRPSGTGQSPSLQLSDDDLAQLIARNIEIKARVVEKDELDRTGERAILNFGHTIGHAIERAGDYRTFLHGEAVSLGIVAACDVSVQRAGLPTDQRDAIVDLLGRFDLPTKLPKDFPKEKISEALKFDKKFEAGQVRFVATPAIGSARLTSDVTLEDIRAAIDAL